MAITSFYLHNTASGVSGTLPATNATVSASTPTKYGASMANKAMDFTIGTSQTSVAGTTDSGTSAQSMVICRWISDRLAAQTISAQAMTVYYAASESDAKSNFLPTFSIAVWRPSNGSLVGRVWDQAINGAEPGTSEGAFSVSSTTSSVTAQDGDVLVIEAWRSSQAQTSPGSASSNTLYFDGTTHGSSTSNAARLVFAETIAPYDPNKSATAELTVTPTPDATFTGSKSTQAAPITNTTTPAASAFVTDLGTLSRTITLTSAASGLVTDTATVAVTVTPTPFADATVATAVPTTFELWENGVFKQSLGTQYVTSTTGAVYELDITPYLGLLSGTIGQNVELRITAAGNLRVDAVEWESWRVSTGVQEQSADGDTTISPTTAASAAKTIPNTAALTVAATPAASGYVTSSRTALAPAINPVEVASGTLSKPQSTALTVTPAVTASGSITDTATADLAVIPTPAASGAVTDTASASLTVTGTVVASGTVTSTRSASVTTSPATTASGFITDTATVAHTVAPVPAASGFVTSTRTADTTVTPIPYAEPTSIGVWLADLAATVTPVPAASGTVTSTRTAVQSAQLATAASGYVTDTASATLTVAPIPAASGYVTDTASVTGTVTPVPVASGYVTSSRTADQSVTPVPTATPAKSTSSTVAVTVAPVPVASGYVTSTRSVAVTVTPVVAATIDPIIDTATADLVITPTPSGSGFITDTASADLTVTPIPAATIGPIVDTASVTQTVTVTGLASATVSKSSTADLTVNRTVTAQGVVWRSRFMRPDSLIAMSGLTGAVADIQDSPTSPGVTELSPTGGPVAVRMSFENHGQPLRTQTGDQKIRVLVTMP